MGRPFPHMDPASRSSVGVGSGALCLYWLAAAHGSTVPLSTNDTMGGDDGYGAGLSPIPLNRGIGISTGRELPGSATELPKCADRFICAGLCVSSGPCAGWLCGVEISKLSVPLPFDTRMRITMIESSFSVTVEMNAECSSFFAWIAVTRSLTSLIVTPSTRTSDCRARLSRVFSWSC